jgi:hypothetical protein
MVGIYWQDLFSSPVAPAVTTDFLCETFSLQAGDELPYLFELRRGQQLEFEIAASTPIDLAACDEAEYLGWVDSGFDPGHPVRIYVEAEEVVRHQIRFTAPRNGDFVVLLMNWNDRDAEVAVKATDQPSS